MLRSPNRWKQLFNSLLNVRSQIGATINKTNAGGGGAECVRNRIWSSINKENQTSEVIFNTFIFTFILIYIYIFLI